MNPKLTDLHDPSLIPDLDRAAERIWSAAQAGESIAIWGDYDVDGVTAAAILYHTIRAVAPNAQIQTYIPHRIDEGYGLNDEGVTQLASDGVRLIISVDCGVTAVGPAANAQSLGVDLIITDHHSPPATIDALPKAFAVVHPGRPDSSYPFPDLCGAGVAYKLAWRVATIAAGSERVAEPIRQLLVDHLALTALGTIADVVPLLDENRVIARFGLSRIKSTPNIGLRALIEASGLAGENVNSEDVGFRLGPRLNACGRMGHAREALELLTTDSPRRAAEIAQQLSQMNDERRATERRIAEEAAALAEGSGMSADDHRAIVLAQEAWHPGVIGIVCSRLVERFGRPTILLNRDGDECSGSCRSVEGFDIHAALCSCADLLESFGGHPMAAGLRIRTEQLPAFAKRFKDIANQAITIDQLTPSISFDCDVRFDELTTKTVKSIESLGPHGRSNPHPAFRACGAIVDAPPQPLGAQGRHLAIRLRQGDVTLKTLAWGWGERRDAFRLGSTVDVLIEPKLNTWRGVVSVEPHLLDVAPA